jgi:carbonic anhydrase
MSGIQKLTEGVHFFRSNEFAKQQTLFQQLVKKQSPKACLITCSDSRIVPELITNANPGDLFVVRNPGNIIPPIGTGNNGEAAGVEYAIAALGVEDIIVCGHTGCGAMKGVLQPETVAELPLVREWLGFCGATSQIMRENYKHLKGDDLLTVAAEENVLVQVEHLHTLPIVAARLGRNAIRLHAWIFNIGSGEIFAFDSDEGQFRPLGVDGRRDKSTATDGVTRKPMKKSERKR